MRMSHAAREAAIALLLPLVVLSLVSCDSADVGPVRTSTADQSAEATIAALQAQVDSLRDELSQGG